MDIFNITCEQNASIISRVKTNKDFIGLRYTSYIEEQLLYILYRFVERFLCVVNEDDDINEDNDNSPLSSFFDYEQFISSPSEFKEQMYLSYKNFSEKCLFGHYYDETTFYSQLKFLSSPLQDKKELVLWLTSQTISSLLPNSSN